MNVETATAEVPVEVVETVERTFPSARCAALGCAAILCADCPLIRLRAMTDEANTKDGPNQSPEQTNNRFDLAFESPIIDISRQIVVGEDTHVANEEITMTPPPVEAKNTTLTYLERLMDDSITSVVADSLTQPVNDIKPEIPELSSNDSEQYIEPERVAVNHKKSDPVIIRLYNNEIEPAVVNVAKPEVVPEVMIASSEEPDVEVPRFNETIFCDVTIEPIALDNKASTVEVVTDEIDDAITSVVEVFDKSTTLFTNSLPDDMSHIDENTIIIPLVAIQKSEMPYSPALVEIDEDIATVNQIDELVFVAVAEVAEVAATDNLMTEIIEMPESYKLDNEDEPDSEQPDNELLEVSIDIERPIRRTADNITPSQALVVEATALLDGKDRLDFERGSSSSTHGALISATARLVHQLAIHALRARVYLYSDDNLFTA